MNKLQYQFIPVKNVKYKIIIHNALKIFYYLVNINIIMSSVFCIKI